MSEDFSKLKRPRHPMPDFVKQALEERGLMEAYKQRSDYQQNDYIGWINQDKREQTKEKKLHQMPRELDKGGLYMNMRCPASE